MADTDKQGERGSYLVFKRQNGGGWVVAREVAAGSADQAIKTAASANGKTEAGEYAAVPARSFHTRKVTVETISKVTLK